MNTAKRLLLPVLLILLALPALSAPAAAQPGPSRFVAGQAPPAPPPFSHQERARAGQLLAVDICTQELADTAVSLDPGIPADESPWAELRPTRTSRTDFSHSAPRALFFEEDADGIVSAGQAFVVPASPSEIYGALWYRYTVGSTKAGDRLQVEIYQVGQVNSGSPIATFEAFDPAGAVAQADGTWRQMSWSLTDPAALATLEALGQAQFLVTLRSAAGGPEKQQVWLDDIDLNACVPSSSVAGTVTAGGAAAAGAQVLLARVTSAGSAIIASTTADVAGGYSFSGVPPLSAGASYQVWYLNAPSGAARPDGRLGFWAGPTIASLPGGSARTGLDMAVGDIALSGPASYSTVALSDASPVNLSWAGRGVAGESYQLCIYDPQRGDPATNLPPQVCGPRGAATQFSLSPQSFSAVPSFDFSYGRSYRWYVVAYGLGAEYGYSFYERAITFTATATAPPATTLTPSATPPAAASSTADWLLMVYAAGDNQLGDPARTSALSRLGTQLGQLRGLASAYPQLHLVTLSDSYGSAGAQLCYLPPARPPSCQERGEINTADPAVLGDFVKTSLARYPARHTMLVIAGPGHPVGGVAPDLTTPGAPSLDPAGLGSAFAAAGLGGGTKLDLLFYQAPLMGSIEVEAASAPYARYMVASPDEYWSLPLYSGLLPLLAGPKQDQPAEVARGVLEVYATVLGGYSSGLARSLAAYDLGQAPAARAALDSLGSAMQTALVGDSATVRAAIGKVLRTIQSYDSSGNGLIGGLASGKATFLTAREDALVDLARLASAISAEPTMPPAVQSAASSLQTASASLTLAYDTASGTGIAGLPVAFSNSLGTSVFFPDGARLGGQPAMVQRYLYGAAGAPRDGAWAEFLRAYLATVVGDGPGGVTAGPQGGARVSIPAGGTLNLDRWLPFVAR